MAVLVNIRSLISRTNCVKGVASRLASTQRRANNSALCLPSLFRALDVNKSGSTQSHHTRPPYRCFSSGLPQKPVLTLFTNDDCTLCDEAMKELSPFLDQVEVEYVDITLPKNKEWHEKYKYDIPVFHLDGEFLMKHRVDLELFKHKLSEVKNEAK